MKSSDIRQSMRNSDDPHEVKVTHSARDAVIGAAMGRIKLQNDDLSRAMGSYASAMSRAGIAKSTGQPTKVSPQQLKGRAFEVHVEETLRYAALAQGVPPWRFFVTSEGPTPGGGYLSPTDPTTDLITYQRGSPFDGFSESQRFQLKMHKDKKRYDIDRATPRYDGIPIVGGTGQGVSDRATDRIGRVKAASEPMSNDEALAAAEAIQRQDHLEYEGDRELYDQLDRTSVRKAAEAGAVSGFILSVVEQVISALKNRGAESEERTVDRLACIIEGTLEGGVRSAAAAKSTQLLSRLMGRRIVAGTVGALPAEVAAECSIDLAKDLYACFVTGTLEPDDLLCNTVGNVYATGAGHVGSLFGRWVASRSISCLAAESATAVGAAIGSPLGPIGTIVGSVVGGYAIGMAAREMVQGAREDAETEFYECVERIVSLAELDETETRFRLIDAMGSLSERRFSFKGLIPCRNLISDLREYCLRRRELALIAAQIEGVPSLDEERLDSLRLLQQEHSNRVRSLRQAFEEQKLAIEKRHDAETEEFVRQSYTAYLEVAWTLEEDSSYLRLEVAGERSEHERALQRLRDRIERRRLLNDMLAEILSDPESVRLARPIVEYLKEAMKSEDLVLERDYISFDEAVFLIGGESSGQNRQAHTA